MVRSFTTKTKMRSLRTGPRHQIAKRAGRSDDGQERQALYKSPRWRQLRAKHLAAFPHCEHCLQEYGYYKKSWIVDHIAGHMHKSWRDLFFEPANLQTLCEKHHNIKTKKERPLSGTAYSHQKRMSEFERTMVRRMK